MEERKDVADFSKQCGVGVWFWKHSRSLRTPAEREEFFKMLHELGVTGAKIDFFDHDHKELVDLYEELLRKAAEHQILLVFHGANKPTGRARMWPNEMVREAVKGMESSRFPERASHQTILPFTRYLAGGADYTTMIFNQRRGDTTWANQIASFAIFDSPLLTIAANENDLTMDFAQQPWLHHNPSSIKFGGSIKLLNYAINKTSDQSITLSLNWDIDTNQSASATIA